MKPRNVLILGSAAGAAPELARAVNEIYPSWSATALDPAAAVERLGSGGCDVVVPVVGHAGGSALLEWLRRNYPALHHVVVDVSSPGVAVGRPDRAPAAQRLGRTLVLGDRLDSPQLAAFAAGLTRIPVISSVYQDICRLLASVDTVGSSDFSLQDVAELVAQDPGMATKVLRVVNSPMYGLRRKVSSLPQAVALLGARRISSLVLGVSISDQIRTTGVAGRAVEKDWHSAMLTAQLSRRIALFEGLPSDDAEAAYLAGLLHNVGRLLLAANLPDVFAGIDWPQSVAGILAVEEAQMGARHNELGALLLDFWGFDEIVTEAVAFYPDPIEGASRGFSPLAAVHGAVALLGRSRLNWDRRFLAQAGLGDRIDKWSRLDAVRQLIAS